MTHSTVSRDVLDYLIAITPICVAAFVAIVSLWQSRINRDKLRLDLYNRRFDIYSRALDFYQALMAYGSSGTSKESFTAVHKAFIKAFRESQFLFDKESGVYGILKEMHSRSFKILGTKDYGKQIADEAPQEFQKMFNESAEAMQWFTEAIPLLEKAMAGYLNFHKMRA